MAVILLVTVFVVAVSDDVAAAAGSAFVDDSLDNHAGSIRPSLTTRPPPNYELISIQITFNIIVLWVLSGAQER